MTSPVPPAVTSDGNVKVVFVTTLADPANPTVAEANAVSAVDLSCYLTNDGLAPSTDESNITDARLCSRQVFEDIGQFTDKLQIKYIYRAQEPEADDNKAFTALKRGVIGYVLVRWGIDAEPALAADDIVDAYPVTCNVQQKLQPADNEKLKIMQNLLITNTVQRDVAIVS